MLIRGGGGVPVPLGAASSSILGDPTAITADIEARRATLVQSLQVHARMLVETSQEMLNKCTP